MTSGGRNPAKRMVLIGTVTLLMVLAYLVGRQQLRSELPPPGLKSGGRSKVEIGLPEFKRAIAAAGLFSGGPDARFEQVGRQTLAKSISLGMMPDDKVLDIGAGSLRVGWWFVQYLKAENYYAVEPVRKRINGAADILGVDINVFYNDDWEFPEVEFDFVIARSIWTHAAKWMIAKMLSEFRENSSQDGKFLTSVGLTESEEQDYEGSEWLAGPPLVRHSLDWIERECARNGLRVETSGQLYKQTWLLITRTP